MNGKKKTSMQTSKPMSYNLIKTLLNENKADAYGDPLRNTGL